MARRTAKKTQKRATRKVARKLPKKKARRRGSGFNEADLTKGQLRKLSALRRSLGGPKIADPAFVKWLKTQAKAGTAQPTDKNAEMIAETLGKLVSEGKLRVRRGGYLVRRGRGRVIVAEG